MMTLVSHNKPHGTCEGWVIFAASHAWTEGCFQSWSRLFLPFILGWRSNILHTAWVIMIGMIEDLISTMSSRHKAQRADSSFPGSKTSRLARQRVSRGHICPVPNDRHHPGQRNT